jgi:hypothetical protein
MVVFNLTSPWTYKCIPSGYNSGEISMLLRDELKNITHTITTTGVFYQNFQLFIDFSAFTMVEGQSFEVEIKEDDVLIYRGKAYATAQTDLQNYELNNGVLKV